MRQQVYPHLRGADIIFHLQDCLFDGVSPPAWGRQTCAFFSGVWRRCIPTCVGQTVSAPSGIPPTMVYPHLRGADWRMKLRVSRTRGVSPPAWGRQPTTITVHVPLGCIPTCVGQTMSYVLLCETSRVYPHLRGADRIYYNGNAQMVGVSPPAWGRRNALVFEMARIRCIPTCVGQTFSKMSSLHG